MGTKRRQHTSPITPNHRIGVSVTETEVSVAYSYRDNISVTINMSTPFLMEIFNARAQ